MTPERWRKVEEIFQAAIDLSLPDRDLFLKEKCGEDSSLHNDVLQLIKQLETAGELLEHPPYGSTDVAVFEGLIDDEDPMIGRRLGAYQIEREIGRGGMGAVYEAVRVDKEFSKRAAIKLVKRGMDTDFILRRFR